MRRLTRSKLKMAISISIAKMHNVRSRMRLRNVRSRDHDRHRVADDLAIPVPLLFAGLHQAHHAIRKRREGTEETAGIILAAPLRAPRKATEMQHLFPGSVSKRLAPPKRHAGG